MTKDVLIVDDDIYHLQLLSIIFESKGFDVAVASDGSKALEMLDNTKFRMMITDFNMPGMNGIELAILAGKQDPGMPVALMSANTRDILEEAAKAGIPRIFDKPLDLRALVASVSSSLLRERFCNASGLTLGSLHGAFAPANGIESGEALHCRTKRQRRRR